MKTSDLSIRGMDCPSCVAHVKGALEAIDGVVSAEVLLAAGRATVVYDEARADTSRMAEAVAAAGYEAADDGRNGGIGGTGGARVGGAGIFRHALGIFGLIAGAVLLFVVAGEWLGLFEAVTRVVPFPVGILVVLLVGWPAFRSVIRAALARRVISHTLMAVGVLAALAVGQWVTAAVVAFFMRVGEFVEGWTLRRGGRALRDLAGLAPAVARVRRGAADEVVPIDAVGPGDIVIVRPGERIPVDGEVVDGRGAVEQAAITGESMPQDVGPGAPVYAATILRGGVLRIRVSRTGEDATFGRIVRMVEEAEASRGRIGTFADRFSGWYLPVVGGVALMTLLIRRDPLATAAVLVVACSCAFAIATPVAMLASIGASARRGLLIKGGAALEALARTDVVLVDKTGTLTVGRPVVADVVAYDGVGRNEVVRLAGSAERDSEHPLGQAILAAARQAGVITESPESFEALEGSGVAAVVAGRRVVVGNERAVGIGQPPAEASRMQAEGMTTVFVSCDTALIGLIGIRDEIRPDVPAALAALERLGLDRVELLTGDHDGAAAPVARELGVRYRAGLLPEDKIRIVREHQEQGRTVTMIGDGVNDAPALARADVGIAMGAAGTDLALEVADIAVMRDDWSLVPEAFRTAGRTLRVVKGNFAFTAVYNLVGLALAATGLLPPILAAAAQSIPDLGILGNSARLLKAKTR